MKRQTALNFNMDECSRRAETIFVHRAGIEGDDEKSEMMREAAFGILRELEDRINVRAIYGFYDRFELEGSRLTVLGDDGRAVASLTCTAFELLNPDAIEGIYPYALTAGDFDMADRPIMDSLYADMWGTAFADAARELLAEELKTAGDSFGPGFYGMDPAEMNKLPLLIDFSGLGIELSESGIIIPEKSCAGILLKVNEKYRKLNSACESCQGNRLGCSLCDVNKYFPNY